MYCVLSSSTSRWDILKKYCKHLTLKSLSETRWEYRVNSVKAIHFQISEVIEALEEVSETTNDPKTKYEAHSLVVNELESYEFILSLVIWCKILVKVNIVSKHLQNENMDLEIGTKLLDGLMTFLENYKENGFEIYYILRFIYI